MNLVAKVVGAFVLGTGLLLSNPNCPTGYSTAPGLNSTTTRNCTSCHGDYSLNTAGGGITLTGLPSTFTAGTSYPFTIKINHSAANRTVWGFSIKAVDTLTHAVVGTWTTTNTNTSIKGTAGGSSYELSHANAATSAAANSYTYSGLSWTAPAVPTAVQARVKFYVAAVAGNNNGSEAGDYVYTTSFTSNQQVAPTPCTFTYGTWTTCSNGTQTRTYTTSPAGCTGTPPADSIQRTCTVTPTLPTAQVITQTVSPGVCDTLRTYSVPVQSGVNYAWAINGAGNTIINGQGTNSITAIIKATGTIYLTLSNNAGSIPTTTYPFTKAVPPTPNSLLGSTTPCSGTTFTYSTSTATPTATQSAVDHYTWTIPAGSSIASATADSSTINIAYGSTFTTGTIAVKAVNACGSVSGAKSISVAPSKPLDLISSTGFWNACIGNSVTYYVVSALVNTGNIYRWTKPLGTEITYANADSSIITLSFITGFRGGALTVKSATSCGTLGSVLSKTLTHVNCAPGARPGVEILVQDMYSITPNPNDGNFTLKIQTEAKTIRTSLIRVFDYTGKMVAQRNAPVTGGLINETFSLNLKRGTYIVSYIIGDNLKSIKMYINK